MLSLQLLGNPAITRDDGIPLGGPATQRHRIALLAVLALSGPRGLSREKLMGYLWPERDAEHARQLLNQAVYSLRRTLGDEVILSVADDLRLDPESIAVDVVAFEAALARRELERAVALYTGPLLDGFFLPEAPEFDRWTSSERERLSAAYARALETLAGEAESQRELERAAEWWKARAAHDPYDSRVALRLMQVLEASGNRAGALQHAGMHERLLLAELDVGPSPEVAAFVARLHREAAVATATSAVAQNAGGAIRTLTHAESSPLEPSPLSSASSSADAGLAPRRLAIRYGVAALMLAAALVAAWVGIAHSSRLASRRTEGRLATSAPAPRPRRGTKSIAAYELYRRGSDGTRFRNDSAMREGVELLRQAIALDPTYAAAWAALAVDYHLLGSREPRWGRARYERLAKDAAQNAVTLDDSLAEAHATLAIILSSQYDLVAAERELTKAVALDPTRPDLHESVVRHDLLIGRPAEALAHARRAVALDTLSPTAHAELARALLGNDRCDEALAELEDLLELHPPLRRVANIAAQCYARKRMWPAAIAALQRGTEGGEPFALATTGYLLVHAGRRQEALPIRDSLLAQWNRGDAVAFDIAMVSAGLGDPDRALDWLERAVTDHSLDIRAANWLVLPGPLADDLRGRPRFDRLLARLGWHMR